MLATDPAPVARPSEGHPGPARVEQQIGSDGAEFSEGRPKGDERPAAPRLYVFLDPYRFDDRTGPERLAHFMRAPAAVQQAFWEKLGRWVERENRSTLQLLDLHGPPIGTAQAPLRWDDTWRTRAYNARLREERGTRDNGFDQADAERLKEIPAEEYVEVLTGEEVPRSGKIACPLPDHDERTPSFTVRGTTWRCFGCQAHGTIYDLASAMWGLELRGAQFLELHQQLMERFA